MSLVDPRLLSSKRLRKTSLIDRYTGIQHRFQSHTKASEIMRNVNLRGKVAMVTGANSGLGTTYTIHSRDGTIQNLKVSMYSPKNIMIQ